MYHEELCLEWNFKGNSCETVNVCVRTCGIHIGWYLETPIIIHAQIEQNGLCREE